MLLLGFARRASHPPPLPAPPRAPQYAAAKAVVLTHNLPSGLWAGLVILQLNSGLRKRRPRLHRAAGLAMGAVSLLLVLGVALMQGACVRGSVCTEEWVRACVCGGRWAGGWAGVGASRWVSVGVRVGELRAFLSARAPT